jgi:LemA protein
MGPIFWIIIVIVVLLIIEFNSIIYLRNRARNSFSTIDVFLKKRFDLIPNLVETVKGYTKYEGETIENITKLRNSFNGCNIKSGNKLNETYNKLIALVESYPDLKASENFLKLQKELTKVEDEIQASRRLYINDVTRYNTKIQKFPHMIFALFIGARPMDLLSFDTEEVKVKF